MINNITWQSYWTFILITVAIYYMIILGFYFTGSGQVVLGVKRKWLPVNDPNNEQSKTSSEQNIQEASQQSFIINGAPNNEVTFALQPLVSEIEAFLQGAAGASFSKNRLLSCIEVIIKKHPVPDLTLYTPVLSNLIKVSCENICSVSVSDEEVSELWTG